MATDKKDIFSELPADFEKAVCDTNRKWEDRVASLDILLNICKKQDKIPPSKRIGPLLNAINRLLQDMEATVVASTLNILSHFVKKMAAQSWQAPGKAILPSLFANYHHHKNPIVTAPLDQLLLYLLQNVLSWEILYPHAKTGLTNKSSSVRMNFINFFDVVLKSTSRDQIVKTLTLKHPLFEICSSDKEQKCRKKAGEVIATALRDSNSVHLRDLVDQLKKTQPQSYNRITKFASNEGEGEEEKSESPKEKKTPGGKKLDFSTPPNAAALPINKEDITGFWVEDAKTVTIAVDTTSKLSRKDITMSVQSNNLFLFGIKGDILLRGKLTGGVREPSRVTFRNVYDSQSGKSRVSIVMRKLKSGTWGKLMVAHQRTRSDLPSMGDGGAAKRAAMMKRHVLLNVGGKEFSTTVETLLKDKNSTLAKMVINRLDDGSWKDNYFWDRDPTHFRHILNFLREGPEYLTTTGLLEGPDNILYQLMTEARHYNITSLISVLVEHERQFSGRRVARHRPSPRGPRLQPSERELGSSVNLKKRETMEAETTSSTPGGEEDGPGPLQGLTSDTLKRHDRQAGTSSLRRLQPVHIRQPTQESTLDDTISVISEMDTYSEVESVTSYQTSANLNVDSLIAQLQQLDLPDKQRAALLEFLKRLKEFHEFLKKRNEKLKREREKFKTINAMMHRKRAQLVQFREKCMKYQKELRKKYGDLYQREKTVKEREDELETNRKKLDQARERIEAFHQKAQNITLEAQELREQKMKFENERAQLGQAVATFKDEQQKNIAEKKQIESARLQVTAVIEKLKQEKKDLEIGQHELVAKRREFQEREADLEDRLATFEDQYRQFREDNNAFREQYERFEGDKEDFDELVRKLKREQEEIRRERDELEAEKHRHNKEHMQRAEMLQKKTEELEQSRQRLRKKAEEASSKGDRLDTSHSSREISRRQKDLDREKAQVEAMRVELSSKLEIQASDLAFKQKSINREREEVRRMQQELKISQDKVDETRRKIKNDRDDARRDRERLEKDRMQLESDKRAQRMRRNSLEKAQLELETEKRKMKDQKKKLQSQLEEATAQQTNLSTTKSSWDSQKKKFDLEKEEFLRNQKKHNTATSKAKDDRRRLMELKTELEERQEALKKDERALKDSRRKMMEEMSDLKRATTSRSQTESELNVERRELKSKQRELTMELEEVESKKKDITRDKQRLKDQREELQQQKVEHENEVERMLQETRKQVRERREALAEEEEALELQRKKFAEEKRSWNKAKFNESLMSEDTERERAALEKERARLKEERRKVDGLQESQDAMLKDRREVDKLKRQIEIDRNELELLYEDLRRSLNLQNVDMANKSAMFRSINEEVNKWIQARSALSSKMDEVESERDKLAREKARITTLEGDLQRKTQEADLAQSKYKDAQDKIKEQERELSKAKLQNDEQQLRLKAWEGQLTGKDSALDEMRTKREKQFEEMRSQYEEEKKRMEAAANLERTELQQKTFAIVEEQRKLREKFEAQEQELKDKLSKKEDEVNELQKKIQLAGLNLEQRSARLQIETDKLEAKREETDKAITRNEKILARTKAERERAEKLAEELRSKLRSEREKIEQERKQLEAQALALEEDRESLEKLKSKGVGGAGVPRGNRHAAAEWRKLEQERAALQALRKNMAAKEKAQKKKSKELEVESKRIAKAREEITRRGGKR